MNDEIVAAPGFALNPALDAAGLASSFRAHGRVRVCDFLVEDGAVRLFQHLRRRDDWRMVINQGEKIFELDRQAQSMLSEQARKELDVAVHKVGREGFQFRYETVRVSDDAAERAQTENALNQFAGFLCSMPVLHFLQRIIGDGSIDFADAQATAYGPGHFLTAHDDAVAGKSRRAAYVLNLTPEWKVDWGGLLQFHGRDGVVEEAYAPAFNVLNLFAVPVAHSVSYVTPFVPYRRRSSALKAPVWAFRRASAGQQDRRMRTNRLVPQGS
jgi:Rps23 Pro-64 3,4-dihydroxylase Tpa1-like proline 4-hydroxylase